MKRLIVITAILLVAVGYITVSYFKNLNPPGLHTDKVVRSIPADAAFIFEFANDRGFYDIFSKNKLLPAVAGKDALGELDTLRRVLLQQPPFNVNLTGQNIFISAHPSPAGAELLLTVASKQTFTAADLDRPALRKVALVTPFSAKGKKGYTFFIKALKKRFYVISKNSQIFSGSFSKQLAIASAAYDDKGEQPYALLPAQQNSKALANLYVNYRQLPALYKTFFKYDDGMLRDMSKLPATAILTLNYKSDALMFNGISTIDAKGAAQYINIFTAQRPLANHLKSIFPSTTAYFMGFTLSDARRFNSDLAQWQKAARHADKAAALFNTVKRETGINIKQAFQTAMRNEFAVVTTRFQERLGIIALKDGSRFLPDLISISSPMSDNSGRLNYDRLPFYLLGEAFTQFRRPYFMVVDNYLILANTYQEIESYYEGYMNRKFLVKLPQYNEFDNLMAQRSNVCFFINFKNAKQVFRRDMNKEAYRSFAYNEPGFGDVFAASYQLTAADGNFYTNFCIALNHEDEPAETDTTKNSD